MANMPEYGQDCANPQVANKSDTIMKKLLCLLVFSLNLALVLAAPVRLDRGAAAEDPFVTKRNLTNAVRLVEGSNDANIAKVTVGILENGHYLKQPFNDEISSKFLDRFLDSLDNLHIYFLQSDLKDFEKYRIILDDLTKEGDTTPARVIFTRFRERLDQQYEYVLQILKSEKFDFTSNDRFVLNRKTLPRPKDLAEARQLWRERVRYEYLQEKLNKEKPDEIIKIITRRYTRILRALNEYDNDDVLQIYLTSLARVYDPHSDYMGKAELENFAIGMKLSLFGIGALLRSEDGYCKIQELKPGPAMRSKKLKPNDRIIAVAQGDGEPVDVVDTKLSKVVELIRGPKGTEVRLTVIPADAPDPSVRKVVSLVREEIKLEDQEAKAKIIELPGEDGKPVRLGLIDLRSFYSSFELEGRRSRSPDPKSTTTDVARLLRKLTQEHVAGVVLDLRQNGGGSLEEAINLTGLFIKEGPVVQVKGSDGHILVERDQDPTIFYEGPLIVLTSRFSASASEILAGALQDYGRALIVGDSSTHGKGTVQSLLQLAPIMRQRGINVAGDQGAVKITIRKFYRASGSSTQLKGVTPDIVFPSLNNHAEVGESSLENPLPWDTIESAKYEKMNRVEPYLSELKRRSDTRLAADADWAYMREEVDRYKKVIAEKSVSMNEAERLKEKKENDDRAKARKKELASRAEPNEKVYEITLKQTDEPGLPPPVARTNHVAATKAGGAGLSETKFKPGELIASNTKDAPKSATEKEVTPAEPKADEDEDSVDDKTPSLDIPLEETKRILVDYIRLMSKQGGLAAH
jgi:carboxyl-terminal processing protease